MAQTPSIPKGTRDYSPEIMVKRNYIFDTIKSVFKLYGYMPLETPAMENLSTLMGKYGEEGDKLLFKILNSGDFIGNIPDQELLEKNSIKLTNKISEKGLRYDLTVPFARFVVQHQNELTFPFIGRDIISSQFSLTSLESPLPSLPITKTDKLL